MHNTRGRVLFLSQGGGVKRDQSGDVPFQRRDRCSGIVGAASCCAPTGPYVGFVVDPCTRDCRRPTGAG